MRFSDFPAGTDPNPGHQKEQDGANNHKKEPLDMDQNNNKGDPLDTKQNNNKGEPLEVAEGLMEALCHIQTKIVRYLDQNDLKNCRLVSRTWCLSMDTWIWANILRYVRAFCYYYRKSRTKLTESNRHVKLPYKAIGFYYWSQIIHTIAQNIK